MAVQITPRIRAQRRDLVRDLLLAKDRAFRLGLYATGQALDAATTKVGWEIADQEERQAKVDGKLARRVTPRYRVRNGTAQTERGKARGS